MITEGEQDNLCLLSIHCPEPSPAPNLFQSQSLTVWPRNLSPPAPPSSLPENRHVLGPWKGSLWGVLSMALSALAAESMGMML